MRLTDMAIQKMPHVETGQKRVRDSTLPGFGVLVGKASKTFFVMYGERRQLKTLGRYPEISLKDARKAALRYLSRPAPKHRSLTRTELLRAFLEHCEEHLRPNTVRRYRAAFKKPIEEAKSPQEVAANKAMYNWGIRNGLIDENPFQYKQAKFGERERLLTEDEVRAIWNYEDGVFSDIVKLLLLTGQRRSQISQLQQSWLTGDTINFPQGVMKSRRPHTIPFNLLTAQYLQPRSFNGWGKCKARMDKETGVTGWVLHDLRRYYSTTMAKLGVPLHITEHLLDHRSSTSGVQSIYMRYGFLKEMRAAVSQYEQFVYSVVSKTNGSTLRNS